MHTKKIVLAGALLAFSATVCLAWVITEGRMTGGGSFFGYGGSVRVTHGFELHCDVTDEPNNLEVNWNGNQFHLETLTRVLCLDTDTFPPAPPNAPFDTYIGYGTGRYNGVPGATAYWRFTDWGEPGTNDVAEIEIRDSGGNLVLLVGPAYLTFGNHQAHKQN